MKGFHPLLKPALEAAALAALLCGVTAVVALVMGLSGQRLMTLYCVNLCAVLAIQIFSGSSGVVSFGHTAFMAVGAYVSAWFTMPIALQRTALPNLPDWLAGHELAVPLALAIVLVAGLVLASAAGLPIARLNGASAAIATLGFLIVVYSVLAAARDFTRGNQAFYGVPRVTDITLALVFACLFILAARLYKDSRYGLMMRAVRDNETAALAVGVSPQRMRFVAWVISGGLAAVAGALYGHMLGAFTPKDFYFHMAFTYVAMLIVGGMGTVTGAVVGVGFVMALQEVLRQFERGFTLGPIQIPEIFGVPIVGVSLAMLLVLWLRPAGLVGYTEFAQGWFGRPWLPKAPDTQASASMEPLRVENAVKSFAGLTAVDDVSFSIERGRVTGLIGPNGAGKSTLVNVITGLYPLTSGTVAIGERNIGLLAPHAVAGAGISRTFQNIRLFTGLGVGENVAVAALARGASLRDALATAERELHFVGLEDSGPKRADSLAYGARRRLEIARALAAEPRFLLLDEPAAGMNPEETDDLARRLKGLPQARGLGLLLIDHDLKFIMSLCDRVVVLNRGRLIADDTPVGVQKNPAVIEAYTGTRASRVTAQQEAEEAATERPRETT
ncbi:ATP-binding cassette domain-containing protein [Aestuariivirga sp.]|uniref:branched-chain amino acid ABC transporter ATP-binding protein/permease n=1 Tax=Aestuariivirga sp. TaxID=2650926 RepID=UPI0035939D46